MHCFLVLLPLNAVFSLCDQNVCENGGNCTQHVFEYFCECPSSYTGTFCEIGKKALAVSAEYEYLYIGMHQDYTDLHSSNNPLQSQEHHNQCLNTATYPHCIPAPVLITICMPYIINPKMTTIHTQYGARISVCGCHPLPRLFLGPLYCQ